ncbi:hypothetical protein ACFLQO_00745, partial [Candidatus Aenigmatarchaeota archaeon]
MSNSLKRKGQIDSFKRRVQTTQSKIAIAGVIGILVVFFVSLSFMGGLYSDVSSVTLGEMSGDDVAMISGAVIDTGERKCTDNDGGLNYHKKGQTTDGMITREDICLNDGLTLKEFFCMDELVSSVRNDCTAEGRVCLNGICAEDYGTTSPAVIGSGLDSGCNNAPARSNDCDNCMTDYISSVCGSGLSKTTCWGKACGKCQQTGFCCPNQCETFSYALYYKAKGNEGYCGGDCACLDIDWGTDKKDEVCGSDGKCGDDEFLHIRTCFKLSPNTYACEKTCEGKYNKNTKC